jgi:1-acyl-sn-glycerol-3-phosphate acyltransferase
VKGLLKIIKLTYTLHGDEHLKYLHGRSYVIMSNHASLYDIPVILAALPGSIRMIAKKELFRVPIWGRAMKIAEFISIDRENRRQAVLDLQNAKEKMQSGIHIWMAPEGTRTRDGKMQDFKRGGFMLAFKTNAIILPVALRGTYEVLPPKSLDFKLGVHVDIYVLPPVDTEVYTAHDSEKIMHLVRDRISSAL